MFCPHCGAQVSEEVNFCPKCGQRIPEEDRVESSFDYGSREKTGRKIWPFLVIGISVVLIAAIVVIYFTVIRPKQNEKTARETITTQTTMEETTTEETTAAETTTAQKTKADS